ncbi:MAG TPA: collagen-like protein [Terriglobales bacterium]|nr:collagen-like protein [Terriglobales bacterium]
MNHIVTTLFFLAAVCYVPAAAWKDYPFATNPHRADTLLLGSTNAGTNFQMTVDAILHMTRTNALSGVNTNGGTNGVDGNSATITIGTVTTGDPGTDAAVENIGTPLDVILNFTIPRGAVGETGPQGEQGPQGPPGSAYSGTNFPHLNVTNSASIGGLLTLTNQSALLGTDASGNVQSIEMGTGVELVDGVLNVTGAFQTNAFWSTTIDMDAGLNQHTNIASDLTITGLLNVGAGKAARVKFRNASGANRTVTYSGPALTAIDGVKSITVTNGQSVYIYVDLDGIETNLTLVNFR